MPKVEYDVLGVGVAAVDDVLTVEKFSQPNVKLPVLHSSRHGGGLACTAMAAVATLGGSAAYMARLGDDELSRYIHSILNERRVDTSHIIHDPKGQPYHSRIVIDQTTGERTIFYDSRHFCPLAPADLPDSLLGTARILFLDFLTPPGPALLAAKARRLNVPIVVDIEGCSRESDSLLPLADHLIVPAEFACWHTGENDPASACAALARVARAATVVTAGASGCWWTSDPSKTPAHFPAFSVDVVNTNGCGDTFHGAYALGIARDLTVAEAIIFSTACAALKASSRQGGWNALPTAADTADFLRSRLGPTDPARAILRKITAF